MSLAEPGLMVTHKPDVGRSDGQLHLIVEGKWDETRSLCGLTGGTWTWSDSAEHYMRAVCLACREVELG